MGNKRPVLRETRIPNEGMASAKELMRLEKIGHLLEFWENVFDCYQFKQNRRGVRNRGWSLSFISSLNSRLFKLIYWLACISNSVNHTYIDARLPEVPILFRLSSPPCYSCKLVRNLFPKWHFDFYARKEIAFKSFKCAWPIADLSLGHRLLCM